MMQQLATNVMQQIGADFTLMLMFLLGIYTLANLITWSRSWQK